MNDDYSFYSDRRRFLQGSGSLVALGSLPAFLTANAKVLQATLGAVQKHEGLVLYREDDIHSVAFADTLAQAGFGAWALTDDPVRLWRDGLGMAARKAGLPLLGLTSWPDYLLLNDLAREQRKSVQLQMQHAVVQPGRANWAASLALGYLQLPVDGDRQAVLEVADEFLGRQSLVPNTPTLFSWLIA